MPTIEQRVAALEAAHQERNEDFARGIIELDDKLDALRVRMSTLAETVEVLGRFNGAVVETLQDHIRQHPNG